MDTITMIAPLPGGELGTAAPYKDDRWFMKLRRKSRTQKTSYCSFCRHHRCGENRVRGSRSLKKSKVITYKHTKFYENSDSNPFFMDLRNGLWLQEEDE
jgi:uncharacterized Fe-S radical SAM superfamily protein PflX